jgi:HEAT repeat protein
MKEQAWLYDLARGWDGSFAYQGSPVGEEEHGKYTSWDSTGAYILAYALPLKSLYITGKRPCVAPAMNSQQVADAIAAGRDYNHAVARDGYNGRTTDQLLAGLASWSPAVRKRSAQGLSRVEGNVLPSLLKLLEGSNREARYGACEALGFLGPKADAACPQLKALLKDPDPWMQSLACFALAELSQETRKTCVNDILQMILTPNPADPRHTAHRAAAVALFNPFPGSRTLRPALQTILRNEDSVARGSVVPILKKLNERELALLLPEIIKATEKLAPSNEMFADGIRLAGLDLLAKHHISEGLELCMPVIDADRWGSGRRYQPALAALSSYGANARHLVPELQKMLAGLSKPRKGGEVDPNVAALEKAIADILADKNPPKLQTAAEFMAKNK